MFVQELALVSEVPAISARALTRVGAALQKQVRRDFAPRWRVQATVDAFAALEDVPIGYWPIIIVEDVQSAAGVHLDDNGQPFALVEAGSSWSLTASHECLEMLGDPFGNRLVAGESPKAGQGRVEFLVEVCYPSEAETFAYRVNGVLVSDFYFPNYFEPIAVAGTRYSFSGAIQRPRQVLRGGYLSWHDPVSNHWWQQTFFGPRSAFRDLGVFERGSQSLRAEVDARTPQTKRLAHLPEASAALVAAAGATRGGDDSSASHATMWRQQIERLRATAEPLPR